MKSWRIDACSIPQAESVPGQAGTTTRAIAELLGERDRVQRAGAAEGESSKSRGSMPLLDRHLADRLGHHRVR